MDQLQSPGLAQLGSVCSVTNHWVPTAVNRAKLHCQRFKLAPPMVRAAGVEVVTGHCPGATERFVPRLSNLLLLLSRQNVSEFAEHSVLQGLSKRQLDGLNSLN